MAHADSTMPVMKKLIRVGVVALSLTLLGGCANQPDKAVAKTMNVNCVVSGEAVVTKSTKKGALELAKLGPNELIGELGVLDGKPRSASVTAATDMQTHYITRDEFVRELNKLPHWAQRMLLSCSEKIRRASEMLAKQEE